MSDYVCDFKHVENRVRGLQTYICRVIRAPSVVRWMPSFISAEEVSEIRSTDSTNHEKASLILIEKILKCTEPGKWKAFIEAVEKAEYPYVASLLKFEDQELEHYQHQQKILQIFVPYLEVQLEPCDIIAHLGALDLINSEDIEQIKACQRSRGSVAATMLMLDRLQCRQKPTKWYTDFLRILYQKGHRDIVKQMEPDFSLDCEVLKVPNIQITDSTDSTVDSNDIVEDMIEARVMYLMSELTSIVKVKNVAPALCQLIDTGKVCQLLQISSQKEAIKSMLEEIRRLKDKRKWRSFIECLKKSDYSHIADLLSRPGIWKLQCVERELLRLFLPVVGQQLNPDELVPHLEEENLINHADKEEISSTFCQFGCIAASVVLLDCLQCRAAPHVWFRSFVKALVKIGREDLAEIIEPEIHKVDERLREESNDNDSYNSLLTRRDETLIHIYKLEKAAMRNLDHIQKHFEEMKDKLKEQIENRKAEMTKTLNEVDELLRASNCGASDVDDDDSLRIGETLQNIISINYTLQPDDAFMKLKEVGVLHQPRHVLQRQNSFDTSRNKSWSATKYRNMNHRVSALRERKQSTTSSSSSASSGYLFVDKSTSLSSSSSAGDLTTNTVSLKHRVLALREQSTTSSSSSQSSSHSAVEKSTSLSISSSVGELTANTPSWMHKSKAKYRTVNEKGKSSHGGQLNQAAFDAVSEDLESVYHENVKSNSSRTSIVSLASSLNSVSELPSSSNTTETESLPLTIADCEVREAVLCDVDENVLHKPPVNAENCLKSNISGYNIVPDLADKTSTSHEKLWVKQIMKLKEMEHWDVTGKMAILPLMSWNALRKRM